MQNHTILTRECVLKMLKAAGKKGKSDRARDLVCGTRVFKCIWWMYMYLLDSSKTATQGAWSGVGVPSWIFSGRRAFALWGPPWRHVMLQRCEFHCDDAAAADDDGDVMMMMMMVVMVMVMMMMMMMMVMVMMMMIMMVMMMMMMVMM